jgi:ferric-dicitrate binding protein FerR (iron transport regulator)
MLFNDYTIKDFLHHELFRKWVINPDHDTNIFWDNWLTEHPDKKAMIEQAKDILLLIGEEECEPALEDQQEVWAKIITTIHAEKRFVIPHWWRYAAVFLGVLVTTVLYYNYNRREIKYTTQYGEVRTIILPDRSIVKLNAHSTLRYKRNKTREIWFDGEGYFSVVHRNNNQPFLVHTTDVNVQVLGTAFNVNTRRVKTQVVLDNGAVRLNLNQAQLPDITMKPGDMVTYSAATKLFSSSTVNPQDYCSWLNNMLVFNNTPITEVVAALQDNLGISIKIEDTGLAQQTFTGTIPMDNAAIFFKTLSRSFNVIIREDQQHSYIISRK